MRFTLVTAKALIPNQKIILTQGFNLLSETLIYDIILLSNILFQVKAL